MKWTAAASMNPMPFDATHPVVVVQQDVELPAVSSAIEPVHEGAGGSGPEGKSVGARRIVRPRLPARQVRMSVMDDDRGRWQFSIAGMLGMTALAALFFAVVRIPGFDDSFAYFSAAFVVLGALIGMSSYGFKGAAFGAAAGLSVVWCPAALVPLLIFCLTGRTPAEKEDSGVAEEEPWPD